MSKKRRPSSSTPAPAPPGPVRVPPHDTDAEQAVLGGLMRTRAAWDQIADRLIEEDFYRHDHQLIFRAIGVLTEQGRPVDPVTLGDWFEAQGLSEQVGGVVYVTELAATTASAANILGYADVVRAASLRRELIGFGTEIANSGYQPEGRDSRELLEVAEQAVFHIAERGGRAERGLQHVRTPLREGMRLLQERSAKPGEVTGIPTGFIDFDRLTSGLQPSDLIVLAGRPSMGKSMLATNFAEHAAITARKAVGIFSMEMSVAQLTFRLLSSIGRIDQQALRTGQLEDEDWSRVSHAITVLNDAKIFIDDTPGLSPAELRSRARRLAREHDLGLLVIDYLQLMHVPGNRENRATEIAIISRSLKALAKELNVPVVALSQLNRALESRTDKRPMMADLRESGAIEADADLIVFIYRDEYYHPDSADKGVAEVILGKHRNGETGTVRLAFRGALSRMDNYAYEGGSG